MSRSRRKPYWSIADSSKSWKKQWHGVMRSRIRMQMHHDPESLPNIVNKNRYSDVYDSPRDGSAQYVCRDETSSEEREKLQRK